MRASQRGRGPFRRLRSSVPTLAGTGSTEPLGTTNTALHSRHLAFLPAKSGGVLYFWEHPGQAKVIMEGACEESGATNQRRPANGREAQVGRCRGSRTDCSRSCRVVATAVSSPRGCFLVALKPVEGPGTAPG